MHKFFRWLAWLLLLLFGAELVARFGLGLGEIPVYIEDPDYEYIYAPNQTVYRFGNRISTNEFSMRSKPISSSDTLVVLKIGDSVINGGAHIDQDSLSSSILENDLSLSLGKTVRVLNISAQSWGPDNAFQYIRKHGNFNADLIVLVFSSHDLHDNMHHQKVVGVHRAWPAEQPGSALADGLNRYVLSWIKIKLGYPNEEYDYLLGFDDSKINPGWEQFISYSRENNIPLMVYLHAEKEELNSGKYNKFGQQILQMLDSSGVQHFQGIQVVNQADYYRDNIHLNSMGHRVLAHFLFPVIDSTLRVKH